ncbi:ATP-binding cassette domain-containing protein [Micromonospora sp. M12]
MAVSNFGRAGAVEPFSLTIHAGEVVGLAGLLGSGRTEVARLLFGADRADGGQVAVDGTASGLRTPPRPSTTASASVRRTGAPRASSPTCRSART